MSPRKKQRIDKKPEKKRTKLSRRQKEQKSMMFWAMTVTSLAIAVLIAIIAYMWWQHSKGPHAHISLTIIFVEGFLIFLSAMLLSEWWKSQKELHGRLSTLLKSKNPS